MRLLRRDAVLDNIWPAMKVLPSILVGAPPI
jgi:hypothetical protein